MNDSIVPLPKQVRILVPSNTHPGLQLDKYASSWGERQTNTKFSGDVQRDALREVVKLSQYCPQGITLSDLLERRDRILGVLNAHRFTAVTHGPLTLHLSRASALENTGLCLHHVYGFAYLPGTGLKGMARAYAETVWYPQQFEQDENGEPATDGDRRDAIEAWRTIEAVFGWTPGSELLAPQVPKPWVPSQILEARQTEKADSPAAAGMVVFHDAWPLQWPQLMMDIVNCHHPDYYQKGEPPGDWEDPNPVTFLAVKPGTNFSFALTRRDQMHDEHLTLAQQWLTGALCHTGAGAKTNAGYGAFETEGATSSTSEIWNSTIVSGRHAQFNSTLELVTPAFLAGAEQGRDDCDLRSATLRGLLRWWWRAMHVGFMDVESLRSLEATIWGDTAGGGAVRIEIFPIKRGSQTNHSHPTGRDSGTRYLAYGMDERSRGERKQRVRLDPPASWSIRITARPSEFVVNRAETKSRQRGQRLTAAEVLEQATAALWLLCRFGGVGSKSRKGFGSLAATDLESLSWEHCQSIARELRQHCQVDGTFSLELAEAPALFGPDTLCEETTVDATPAAAIECVGRAYAAIASRFKHNADQQQKVAEPNKAAWGLPRKIHGPRESGPIQRRDGSYVQKPETWQPPEWLDFPKRPPKKSPENARHASPIHIHIDRADSGGSIVRVLAVPATFLPDRTKSVEMLRVFTKAFQDLLAQMPTTGTKAPKAPVPSGKRPSGTPARVRILAERAKGGYDVQENGYPSGTLTVGTPPDPRPESGVEVDVEVHNDDPKRPQYRWPDAGRKQKSQSKGGPPPRRRR